MERLHARARIRRSEVAIPLSIRLRQLAYDDLRDIWLFTARRWGIEQAERYEAQLREAFARLAETPGLGTPLQYRGLTYCRWRRGRHLVIYREDAHTLAIIRIVHDQSDLPARLDD